MKGVKVSNFIVPMSVTDTYPTHLDIFGKGGIHSVDAISNRDAITTIRRSEGMLSFTKSNESMYALLGGITNDKWFKLFDFSDNKVNFNIACDPNYVLLGNKDGIAKPSPRLRDMQFDIIDLRMKLGGVEELNTLDHNKIWIGDYNNKPIQQLHINIINLPPLAEALFPNPISELTGDFRIPNPTFDYLSPFDWAMSGPFLPQIYATKYDNSGNPIGTDVSSSLAMTQVRTAQIMKRFDNANFIVGSSTVEFLWENPKMALIPQALKDLYDLGTTYTFTKAQSLGNLETGLLKNTVDNGTGTLSKAVSGEDYVNTADFPYGYMTIIDPLYPAIGTKLISPSTAKSREKKNTEFSAYPNDVTVSTPIIDVFALKVDFFNIDSVKLSIPKTDIEGNIISAVDGEDYLSPISLPNDLSYQTLAKSIANILGSTVYYEDPEQTIIDTETTLSEVSTVSTQTRDETFGTARTGIDILAGSIGIGLIGAGTSVVAAPALAAAGTVIAAAGLFDYLFGHSSNRRNLTSTLINDIQTEQKYNYIYGLMLKGTFLNISNSYKSSDITDDALLCNPVLIDNPESPVNGQFKFLDMTTIPNNITERGRGTMWFDSYGKSTSLEYSDSTSGLRLFSWNSNDYRDAKEKDPILSPIHIGIFGYTQNSNTITRHIEYVGCMFQLNFEQNAISPPTSFGLYVGGKSYNTTDDIIDKSKLDILRTIFEYDLRDNLYNTFDYHVPVKFLDKTAIKIPVGNTLERPSNAEKGMLRYNIDL